MNGRVVFLAVLDVVPVVGVWGWRRWHPASFWYLAGCPARAVLVCLTWAHVASGCGAGR